jgi:predicted dehydrogenase
MRRSDLRVGLIGSGDTAGWRARALRAAGLEIASVSSRPESTRLRPFAMQHGIPLVFDAWTEMLAQPERWDALAICTWPDATPDILSAALGLDVPVFVEKPVAWSSRRLAELCERPHERVIVGYNRRFYPSVQAARKEALEGPPLLAQLTLPKDVVAPDDPDPTASYLRPFFESVSALGIDVARFVLGELRLETVRRLKNPAGNLYGMAAILSTERGDLVQLTANLNAAANFSLTLNRPGRRFDLMPFEIATLYEGLEVIQPTPEYPVRRYSPKVSRRIALEGHDLVEKPGFVAEAMALRTLMEGEPRDDWSATLEDAFAVTKLCEELTGVTL